MTAQPAPGLRTSTGWLARIALACLLWTLSGPFATAQDVPLDPRFRYQGELRDGGVIVDGLVDIETKIFDQPVGGIAVDSTLTFQNVTVTRGVFEITITYNNPTTFFGSKRYLELAVRNPTGVGAFTTLTPRIQLFPTPYAHYAREAKTASFLAGFNPSNYVQKAEPGSVTPGMLAAGTVDSASIADGTIDVSDLSAVAKSDLNDASSLGGILSGSFLRSDANDTINASQWFINAGSPNEFTIDGLNLVLNLGNSGADQIISVGRFSTDADATFGANATIDGSATLGNAVTDSHTVNGSIAVTGDAALAALDVAGALSVESDSTFVGQATFEQNAYFDRVVGMSLVEADQSLYYYDQGSITGNSIKWDDVTSISCAPFGTYDSAFLWQLADSTNTGWIFRDGSDYEVFIDETGNIVCDGAVTASSGCDLAESFFAPAELAPGTVVALIPGTVEYVEPSQRAYQPGLVGVVSSKPGLVLDGPSYDTLPLVRQHAELDRLLAERGDDEDLARQFDDLELALDSAPRGNVPVALAGRVPVLVVGRVIAGEPLTSSHVPGHAMALDRPGRALGIALEDKVSEGTGEVLMLVQPGYQMPFAGPGDDPLELPLAASDDLETRLQRLESILVARDGRDGVDGHPAHDGLDGTSSQDVALDDTRGRVAGTPVTFGVGANAPFAKEAWGDFDADGRDDVFVVSPGGTSALHHNLGDGLFVDVSEGSGLGDLEGIRLAAWRDVDGDRHLDLLLVDRAGVAHLHQGRGTGRFVDVTAALGLDFGQPVTSAEWVDHDHDGLPDLRVTLGDGRLVLHHNLGGGAFRAVELASGAGVGDVDRVAQLEMQLAALQTQIAALVAAQGGAR